MLEGINLNFEVAKGFKDEIILKRTKREAVNPKYHIGQELKIQVAQKMIFKNGEERDYLKVLVKESTYSPSLEDNIYNIVHIETVGQIEEWIEEKELSKMIKTIERDSVKYICHCGNTLRKDTQPDIKPDGSVLGYPIWKCDKCEDTFDEEDLKKENIKSYEVTNYKENKVQLAYMGSPRLIDKTISIEFDLLVESNGYKLELSYTVPYMLPTDFEECIEKLATRIAGEMDKSINIKESKEINTIAEVILKYKEKEYKFNFDFGSYIPGEAAEYLFDDGNYACDCNRSLFIKQYCDKDFQELPCGGEEIELISFKIIQEGKEG